MKTQKCNYFFFFFFYILALKHKKLGPEGKGLA